METLFVGTNLLEFDCLPSTNNFLLDLSKLKRLPEGTLVWAKDQQEGRGQYGKVWQVMPNLNLTFSLIFYPKFISISKQFAFSKMVALSLFEYLDTQLDNVSIKWPNDIYVGDKKIAGTLIENAIDQSGIKQSVVGVGLNVNQLEFSPELINATSIKSISGVNQDLKTTLNGICRMIEKNYLKLKIDSNKIDSSYLQQLYRKDVWKNYQDKNGSFEGKLIGVDASGKLEIEDRNEILRTYNLQEVSYL
ncbi:MAG: BirA family biotin operon repressor/biotin-[acetyl-CoA-carboxylase] ligase [Flavobacteriales bacterium]|jgi:BirA family biotin operon repressor/biotin-[acetyl-CoA-carboxylase] ligase